MSSLMGRRGTNGRTGRIAEVCAFIDIVYLKRWFCVLGDASDVNEFWCGWDNVVGIC